MKIKDIKLIVENGGGGLDYQHLQMLFSQIERTNDALKRIKKLSVNHDANSDIAIINDIADAFIIED